MIIRLTMLIAATMFATHTAAQLQVGEITFADTFEAVGQPLNLNGAGQRRQLFIELYVAGLYLSENSADPEAIVGADEPMVLQLQVTSGLITSERMAASTEQGFELSLREEKEIFRPEIDLLISAFSAAISEGDIFDIIYQPSSGISIRKNGETVIPQITGLDFKKALWGIWLGRKPVDRGLKAALLGGNR